MAAVEGARGRLWPRAGAELSLLAAVVAAGFNLRIAIAAVGPLIEDIRADLDMSSTVAGVLTAIPFACIGIFALLGPYVLGRQGPTRVVVASMALIAVFSVTRAVAPTAALLLLLTVPIGLGIALASVTLPGVVKQRFPRSGGRTTGYYVAALSLGGAVTALCIVPISEAIGGWRPALAVTAVPAAIALSLWVVPRLGLGGRPGEAWRLPRLPSREQIVIGLLIAAVAMGFLGTVSWIAAVYLEAGWSAAAAAAALGAILLGSAPANLVFPALSSARTRPTWTSAAAALMAVGIAGVAFAPTTAAPVWLAAFAIGNGALFPLVLTLPLDVSPGREQVARTAAWAMAIGFLLGATAPIWIGALRDASGGFTLPMALLAALCFTGGLLALTLRGAAARAESMIGSN